MARVKRAVNAQKKKRKVMKLAKGTSEPRASSIAPPASEFAAPLRYAYIGRAS